MELVTTRSLRISRERPHIPIAALALVLLAATVVLKISIPTVFIALLIGAAALGTIVRPEIGLHVLVINALVGLTHVVETPRLGPFSAPVLIEGLVL
ncbi:MAG TPA: hypothetical protein VFP98_09310, partial [Candidatus Polarisedimenticolia bacterium]|nr:hypothetical protein [Candidatus Polarisedimenticolia bacterium]